MRPRACARAGFKYTRMRSSSACQCQSTLTKLSFDPLGATLEKMAHKGKDKAPDTSPKSFVPKEEVSELLDDKIKADISEAIKPLLTASKDSASSSASSLRVRRTLVSRLRGRFIALRPLFSKKIVCQFLISRPRQKILPRGFCRYIYTAHAQTVSCLVTAKMSLLNDCKMAST